MPEEGTQRSQVRIMFFFAGFVPDYRYTFHSFLRRPSRSCQRKFYRQQYWQSCHYCGAKKIIGNALADTNGRVCCQSTTQHRKLSELLASTLRSFVVSGNTDLVGLLHANPVLKGFLKWDLKDLLDDMLTSQTALLQKTGQAENALCSVPPPGLTQAAPQSRANKL